MEVRIQYQGIEGSPLMTKYMEGKLARLERYLSSGSLIIIDLISDDDFYTTSFTITTPHREYNFEKDGCDIFEAFSLALDEAAMNLRLEHLKIRDRFNQIIDSTEL